MNLLLLTAGILAIVIGLIHSVLGEVLIFKRLRNRFSVPSVGAPPLHEKHIRILWATWHVATVFGCILGAILICLSIIELDKSVGQQLVLSIAGGMLVCGCLVLVATKARHPGWVGLICVAILCWMSQV